MTPADRELLAAIEARDASPYLSDDAAFDLTASDDVTHDCYDCAARERRHLLRIIRALEAQFRYVWNAELPLAAALRAQREVGNAMTVRDVFDHGTPGDPLVADVDLIANALRRADYMNWSAAEVAEKISGTVESLLAEARQQGRDEARRAPLDRYRELAYRFWVHYRCGYVDCEIVTPHEHGGGEAAGSSDPGEAT